MLGGTERTLSLGSLLIVSLLIVLRRTCVVIPCGFCYDWNLYDFLPTPLVCLPVKINRCIEKIGVLEEG